MNAFMRVAALLLVVLFLVSVGYSSVPNLINFQGRLTTASGPVSDSSYSISFTIFDAPVGGIPLWTEVHTSVPVAQGLFTVILGAIVPLADSVFNSPSRYLEISIGSERIIPRSQLTSVGYAQRVATVDGAHGGDITGQVVVLAPNSLGGYTATSAAASNTSSIVLGFSGTSPMLTLYEPVDSRAVPGASTLRKSMELGGGQLVVFGSSENDTNLIVSPNGDIVGVGQITMGLNSSSGSQTSVLGFQNSATGDSSAIGGGSGNITTGTISVIAGGHANSVSSEGGTVSGGAHNNVSGPYAVISGGENNVAEGSFAAVAGGLNNAANGDWSMAAGRRAKALTHGSFVWSDHQDSDFVSTGEDQFLIRARGGVGIGTSSPMGLFDVEGSSGDSIVNLPNSTISGPEILDEPGIATTLSPDIVALPQRTTVPQILVTATITIPAPGYIVVHGSTTVKAYGASERDQAYIQIGTSPSSALSPSARLAGLGAYESATKSSYFDLNVEQIFFEPAGTYTFYLEGLAHPMNDPYGVTELLRPALVATYFSTSYGIVSGYVTSQETGNFTESAPVSWPIVTDSLTAIPTPQYFKVDLRELELATMRAKTQAAILEKQLLEAQIRQRNGQ